jgi:hypothetical protein
MNRLECPSCGNPKLLGWGSPPLSIERELERRHLSPWWAERGWSVGSGGQRVQWACRHCLDSGRAILADPAKQLYCDWPPYLAYFDTTHECADCHDDFVFSKEEQRFWYEELGFWVQSRPKQCSNCRRKRRMHSRANAQLQNARGTRQQRSRRLSEVAQLYLEVGSRRKAVEFLRRATNRAQNDQQRDAFRVALVKMESQSSEV